MAKVRMFLDDERFPIGNDWVIVRSVSQAQLYMQTEGCPSYISFDHDLGDNLPTGFDLVKWMIETDMDLNGAFVPFGFQFYVHSANPVGAKNIQMLLEQYLRVR